MTWATILSHSLAHVCAYDGEHLVGFANVAWNGGVHAFLLDPEVHREWQRQGIGTRLVRDAAAAACRGAHWHHVDYGSDLRGFYEGCGFQLTLAGLMRLA